MRRLAADFRLFIKGLLDETDYRLHADGPVAAAEIDDAEDAAARLRDLKT